MKLKKRYQVDLPAQQAQCEANYHRLQRLFGCPLGDSIQAFEALAEREFVIGDNPTLGSVIRLRIMEQTKYTSLVHIVQTSVLPSAAVCVKNSHKCIDKHLQLPYLGNEKITAYEANIRLYHDVGLAEVISCQQHRQFHACYEYPNKNMHQADEKMQLNSFLSELLAHCLGCGRVNDVIISPEQINRKYA